MALLAPFVIPGFDRVVLKLLIIVGVILVAGVVVTISSIVGVIRAVLRLRRSGHSVAAVVLAVIANVMTVAWLLYWVADDIHHNENPINVLLAINFAIALLPLSWLVAAVGANVARGRRRNCYEHFQETRATICWWSRNLGRSCNP